VEYVPLSASAGDIELGHFPAPSDAAAAGRFEIGSEEEA
jgi:hypothetical protein